MSPTPGPWFIEKFPQGWFVCAPDSDDPEEPWYVAKVFDCEAVNAEQNAQLIAQAPEMLAALKMVLKYIPGKGDYHWAQAIVDRAEGKA